jgi:hypothetical protein
MWLTAVAGEYATPSNFAAGAATTEILINVKQRWGFKYPELRT